MKKFLFSFITPLLVSLFFFIPQVKADVELNSSLISSQISSYINSDFNYVMQNAPTYCTNSADKYVIFIYNNEYYLMCQTSSSFQLYSYSFRFLFYYINAGGSYFYKLVNGSITSSSMSIDKIELMHSSSDPLNMSSILYYSDNITQFILTTENGDNYYFTYGSNTYYFKSNEPFPSLYSIYLDNSTPPDNTPVLTSFYTLVIDKFSVLADFFTDNTYLFAIPLIPILILCIYLIKRSLIK